ncbi:unnamed protein product [Ascophyllum nodosum]
MSGAQSCARIAVPSGPRPTVALCTCASRQNGRPAARVDPPKHGAPQHSGKHQPGPKRRHQPGLPSPDGYE